MDKAILAMMMTFCVVSFQLFPLKYTKSMKTKINWEINGNIIRDKIPPGVFGLLLEMEDDGDQKMSIDNFILQESVPWQGCWGNEWERLF